MILCLMTCGTVWPRCSLLTRRVVAAVQGGCRWTTGPPCAGSSFGGLAKKQTVIFAPDTGKLLAYEEMLTKDAGALNVKIPSVTEYVTHLDHGYTRGG
jgi:hypothetical protein